MNKKGKNAVRKHAELPRDEIMKKFQELINEIKEIEQ
jgi:hypothetical protein